MLNLLISSYYTTLLSTPNWSVGIAIVLLLLALITITPKIKNISLSKWDKTLVFSFIFYFISAIPNFIISDFNGRILDGPSRAILMIPIFCLLLANRKKINGSYLAIGVFLGAMLSAVIAYRDLYLYNKLVVDGFLFSINFSYIAMSLAILSCCYITYHSRKPWLIASLSSIVCALFSCFMTGSRGGMLALPLLFLIPLFIQKIDTKKYAILSILLMILVSVFVISNPRTNEKLSILVSQTIQYDINKPETTKTSIGTRINFWTVAFRAFLEKPLTGMTYQERVEFYNHLVKDEKWPEARNGDLSHNYAHAHSEYFEALASKGLMGIFSLLAILFVPLIYFVQFDAPNHKKKCHKIAGISFIVAFMIFGISEAPLLSNSISVYYLFTVCLLWSFCKNESK